MHSHIAIEGPDGSLAFKPDTDLTITDKNPMFNDVEMFSQPIQLPIDLNRHILKNIDDVNAAAKATDIEGNGRYRIIADGIPFRTANIKAQDGENLDGYIDVNFDATNRTFKDMIADMNCRDVEVDDDILIGEKIGDVDLGLMITPVYVAHFDFGDGTATIIENSESREETFQPFALGFSFPGECYEDAETHEALPDPANPQKVYPNPEGGNNIVVKRPYVKQSYINIALPYPTVKYCNSRIAYAHHKVKKEEDKPAETDSDIVPASERNRSIQEDKSPYWVLDANRPASGICFYVAYFLERLFKKLGVAYDMTALTNIEDFNYLAFMNTGCHYDSRPKEGVVLTSQAQINNWLSSRGCGGKINIENADPQFEIYGHDWTSKPFHLDSDAYNRIIYEWTQPNYGTVDIRDNDGSINLHSGWVKYSSKGHPYTFFGNDFIERGFYVNRHLTAKVMQMFANSDNFPDADVTEVIESLENSFGVRFCYDADINKVTVKLLRDMFRDTQAPEPFKGIVTKMVKRTEIIKGVRMKYSKESDAREQRENIQYGKRDYDTIYDYVDYPQKYTKFATFEDVTNSVDVGNRTGYCDLRTGNFYRIKVSSDASTTAELRPAVFEVGAMHGVELGDCSEEAEKDGRIKEFVSDFIPIEVNDVAYRGKNYSEQEDPLLVPFVEEDMEHEFLTKKMINPISTKWGSLDIVYELCLAECYDPTKTDDGQSPLQHHEWGLTIGFLRPATSTEEAQNYNYGYDLFGNSQWLVTAKNYALNSDTFDEHANFLGRNAQSSFSLKPRAYKPFRYKYVNDELLISTDPKQWENESGWLIPCNDDTRNSSNIITQRLRSRGLCDSFMIEFFHFLLNRQVYHVEAICTAAELADIPNKWLRRFVIDGKVGWLNSLTYPVSMQNGIGKVEIEFYAL